MFQLSRYLFMFTLLTGILFAQGQVADPQKKIMVVMSYEQNYPWVKQIKEGIELINKGRAQIEYIYLNTKTQREKSQENAQKAFQHFQKLKPDGVIVCDDDAQKFFTIPYLSNKVSTPVIFCGVNAPPEQYNYPSSNVTGVLERELIKESLIVTQKLIPQIKTFSFIGKDDSTTQALVQQIEKEKKTYPLVFNGAVIVANIEEAIEKTQTLKKTSDILLYITLEGLKDNKGKIYHDEEIIPKLIPSFGKPLISNNAYRVESGALSAVVKTGIEQGSTAAKLLFKAITGTPISRLKMTTDQFGERIINVDMLKYYNIKADATVLRSSKLVKRKIKDSQNEKHK